jgi:hypothetical protein
VDVFGDGSFWAPHSLGLTQGATANLAVTIQGPELAMQPILAGVGKTVLSLALTSKISLLLRQAWPDSRNWLIPTLVSAFIPGIRHLRCKNNPDSLSDWGYHCALLISL